MGATVLGFRIGTGIAALAMAVLGTGPALAAGWTVVPIPPAGQNPLALKSAG